jgi:hypothetical protein
MKHSLDTITNDTFKFIELNDDDFFTIQLLEDPYKHVKYQYSKVNITEDKNNGEGILKFSWALIEGPPELEDDPDFQNFIGLILHKVILNSLDLDYAKIGNMNDKQRDSDNDSTGTTQ